MRYLIPCFILCFCAVPAQGQEAGSLIGQRVWIRSPKPTGGLDGGVQGTLTGFSGDSAQLQLLGAGSPVSVLVGRNDRVFVFAGRRSAIGRGAAIGGGGGALAGLFLGLVAGEDCSGNEWICFDRGEMAAALAITLGGVGLLSGTIVGALSHRDTWGPAGWPRGVQPVVRSSPGGLGVGFAVRF